MQYVGEKYIRRICMGKIISKFRNANRIKEYEECLEILDIVPDKDYILESQLDNGGGGWDYVR